MEKSLEKIKHELEQKRKYNIELIKELKQKSILYKVEKEKQKNYFLNKTSTFRSKKRKPSSPIINEDNNQKELSSYELMNLNNDYDEYYEDFMNNSMISNKTFNYLNFSIAERFSFQRKKLKLFKKTEEGFSIIQGIKTKKYQIDNNISFQSGLQQKTNNNDKLGLKFLSNNKNLKKNENNISFFENINKKDDDDDDRKISNNDPLNIKGGLFGTPNISNNNEKSLFSSNKPTNIINEKKTELKDASKEKKEPINLFGNIERLKDEENKKQLYLVLQLSLI